MIAKRTRTSSLIGDGHSSQAQEVDGRSLSHSTLAGENGNAPSSAPSNISFQFADPKGMVRQSFHFDGSVVVLKTCEESSFLFQASREILSSYSLIFKDMFSLPQPENAERFNGHPLVVVQDEAYALDLFLRALHYYQHYFANNEWKTQTATAAVLRLATKYQVSHLRKTLIDHFSECLYSSYYLDLDPRSQRFPTRYLQDLHLAKEVGALRILPTLYYLCASDLDLATLYKALNDWAGDIFFCNDIRLCLELRETLANRTIDAVLKGGSQLSTCSTPDSCNIQRLLWIKELATRSELRSNLLDLGDDDRYHAPIYVPTAVLDQEGR